MNIQFIHNNYGKFSGEEAVVQAQIRMLRDNNHNIITYFRSSEEIDNSSFGKIKAFFTGIYNSDSITQIRELIQNESPDLVHIHNLYPLISPAILPVIKKMRIPIVMTVHNYRLLCPNGLFFQHGSICEKCTDLYKEWNCVIHNCEDSVLKSTGYALRNFWARVNKYYLENVDIYSCLTQFQKDKLTSHKFPVENCVVLPNFYDNEIKKFEYQISKRNYVAFSGRISQEKGVSILVKAAKLLPHIPFHLAGAQKGNFMDKFEIPENVILRGMLNENELSDFYLGARFLILPSIWYEGFPMVLPEAMAHGLPLIAPNMAGFPEIAEENINALLFEKGNPDSLAQKIEKLWQDSELASKLAANSYNIMYRKYSAKVYYEQLMKLYDHVCKKYPAVHF